MCRADFSFIPSRSLRWLAVVVSAASAGICEEIGFRGYVQRPIEERHGAPIAILISSSFGLFAYWWTGIAGDFTARPITETGVDRPFLIACAVFATSLLIMLLAMSRLGSKGSSTF